MTPARLAYLADRAAAGFLTLSEQREVMDIIHKAFMQLSQCYGWKDDFQPLATAAKLPPVRKRWR